MQERFRQGLAFHRQGKLVEAEHIYDEVLQRDPTDFAALHLLGVIALQTGRTQRGVELISKAIGLNSKVAAAYNNLGNGLSSLKRFEDALANYDKAIALKPDYAEAYYNRGNVLRDLGRSAEDALASYDKAIALKPDYGEAYYNRGNALNAVKRFADALASYDKVIALNPDDAAAHNNRANVLNELRRRHDALASYDRAIALRPNSAMTHNNRGAVLNALQRPEDALGCFDKALELDPDNAEAHHNRGTALAALKRFEDALTSYDKAVALKPDGEFMYGDWITTKMRICDWGDLDDKFMRLVEKVELGQRVMTPFPLLAISSSPELLRKAAETWTRVKHPPVHSLPEMSRHPRRDKIRVGYFSSDFRDHALAYLMAELFERHDRSRFEIAAFSFAPPSKAEMQQRLRAAFDRFIDVQDLSDPEVAMLARSAEIDIAVDLNGFTTNSRTNIFAMRAAPIQVSYLGYAGTMAADYIDYLIADATLIPAPYRRHYTEKIVYLPHTYLARDTQQPIADSALTRTDVGLPEEGFVFCCFNNNQKIRPGVFDVWMRILQRVQGSVLWLLEDNAKAASNLRTEAELRGVDSARLVFAKRVPVPVHLARHRLADLFLDTLPFNAHTTASDALWMGLPVLTQIGETFAGRVAASLLIAAGIPELIVSTPEAYQATAIELALNPAKLDNIKHKLARSRLASPVFDTVRLTRNFEAAYVVMVERHRAGMPPDHIHISNETEAL